jgi:uncharacterized protein YggE
MKKLLFFVVLATVIYVHTSRAQQYVAVPEQRLVTVTGEAEVKVVPDVVELSLVLTTSDIDLATDKKLNNDRVKNLLAVTAELKIEPKHIQTGYISIDPNYWRSDQRFTVRRSVVITLKDVTKFDDVLTRLVQNNRANSVDGINFRTSQLRKYRDQARSMAAQAAREKADDLAAALGVKAGKPFSIREDQSYWNYWGGRYASMSQNVQVNAQVSEYAAAPSTTLSPGQISVSARVTVAFELE